MMRKNIDLKTILTAICASVVTCVAAQRITSATQVIDCGQVLFMKPVTAQFELLNEGVGNVTIRNVETSCGCTQVSYPKGVISENKPFVISATYDARQMGRFEKYIDVYTSGASLPFTLTIKGVVVEEIRDFAGGYDYTLGKLKTDRTEIMFDDVSMGERPTEQIHIFNSTGDIATPVLMHLPPYLIADVSPSSIPPGKSGVITLTLDSKRLHEHGLTQTTVYLGQKPGDRVSEDKEIQVTAILLPSFGLVTDQQLLYSPKLKISDSVLDLGAFEGKKKKKGTIVLENVGRTELENTALQMFTTGLMVDLTDTKIPPGGSVKLKVTADRKALKNVRQQPRVLMITNDPRTPKVVIDVLVKQ